jgi:mannitol-1-phosphate/altronate dehydrogenase
MCALLAATFVRVLTDPSANEPQVREGLRDPALEILTSIGSRHSGESDRVRAVLLESGIFPAQLSNEETFIADCAELAEILRRGGVRAAIRSALEQVSSEPSDPGDGVKVPIEPSPARAK